MESGTNIVDIFSLEIVIGGLFLWDSLRTYLTINNTSYKFCYLISRNVRARPCGLCIFVSEHRSVHDSSLLVSDDDPINFKGTKAAKYDLVEFFESPLLPVEQRQSRC